MLFVSVSCFDLSCAPSLPIELRLDLFAKFETKEVRSFLQRACYHVMVTLRAASQGGKFQGTEAEQEALIEELLAFEPPFFDLEWTMRREFLEAVIQNYPKTKFVLSHHDFVAPPDLPKLYAAMREVPAWHYKIAANVRSTIEALEMLLFSKRHADVSVICMGEKGAFARVLGPVVGNVLNYACLDETSKTAPGQLTAAELLEIYHFASLNQDTAIYGLIGDPVAHSIGHLHHNGVFRARNINAIYVKMQVTPEELPAFLPLAIELGIQGLSVTMPLKEKVMPEMGSVNTLRREGDRFVGTNTDGAGALDAIEKRMLVRGKKVALLGAGGAARAIALEAKKRGASVVVLNRTLQRALDVAREVGCEAGGLENVPEDTDVVINCSPDAMASCGVPSRAIAMDVVYAPRETPFLQEAARRGCSIVYGEEMFFNQAAGQTTFWFG